MSESAAQRKAREDLELQAKANKGAQQGPPLPPVQATSITPNPANKGRTEFTQTDGTGPVTEGVRNQGVSYGASVETAAPQQNRAEQVAQAKNDQGTVDLNKLQELQQTNTVREQGPIQNHRYGASASGIGADGKMRLPQDLTGVPPAPVVIPDENVTTTATQGQYQAAKDQKGRIDSVVQTSGISANGQANNTPDTTLPNIYKLASGSLSDNPKVGSEIYDTDTGTVGKDQTVMSSPSYAANAPRDFSKLGFEGIGQQMQNRASYEAPPEAPLVNTDGSPVQNSGSQQGVQFNKFSNLTGASPADRINLNGTKDIIRYAGDVPSGLARVQNSLGTSNGVGGFLGEIARGDSTVFESALAAKDTPAPIRAAIRGIDQGTDAVGKLWDNKVVPWAQDTRSKIENYADTGEFKSTVPPRYQINPDGSMFGDAAPTAAVDSLAHLTPDGAKAAETPPRTYEKPTEINGVKVTGDGAKPGQVQLADGSIGLSYDGKGTMNADGTANNGIGVPGGGAFSRGLRDQNSGDSQYIAAGDPLQQEARTFGGRYNGAPQAGQEPFTIQREGPFKQLLDQTGRDSSGGGRVSTGTRSAMADAVRAREAVRREHKGTTDLNNQILRLNRRAQVAMDKVEQKGGSAKSIRNAGLAFADQAKSLSDAAQIGALDRKTAAEAAADNYQSDAYLAANLAQATSRIQAAGYKASADQITDSLKSTAAAFVPEGTKEEEYDTEVGKNGHYMQAFADYTKTDRTPSGIARENSRAIATGRFLDRLSKEAGSFSYSSLEDLTSGHGSQLTPSGKIAKDPLTFWRALFEDGLWDASWGELTGKTEITLPGTSNTISYSELQKEVRMFDRKTQQDIFEKR